MICFSQCPVGTNSIGIVMWTVNEAWAIHLDIEHLSDRENVWYFMTPGCLQRYFLSWFQEFVNTWPLNKWSVFVVSFENSCGKLRCVPLWRKLRSSNSFLNVNSYKESRRGLRTSINQSNCSQRGPCFLGQFLTLPIDGSGLQMLTWWMDRETGN